MDEILNYTIQDLENIFSRALPFAVELNYFNTETLRVIPEKTSLKNWQLFLIVYKQSGRLSIVFQ